MNAEPGRPPASQRLTGPGPPQWVRAPLDLPALRPGVRQAEQSHTCVPGVTVDAAFGGRPPRLRAVYDAILAHLQGLGPVHEDAVSLALYLPRPVRHPRIAKVLGPGAPRVVHVLLLREPEE